MIRVLVLVTLASATARADRCAPAPSFTGERNLSVVVVPAPNYGYPLFVPTPNSVFPAVSKDGGTLVTLATTLAETSGVPTTTLVFWSLSPTGTTDAIAPGDSRRSPSEAALLMATANARLGRTTWLPATVYTCAGAPVDTLRTALGPIHFDKARQELRGGHTRTAVAPPGRVVLDEGETGSCGAYAGIASAFGTDQLVIVNLAVRPGGDECMVATDAGEAVR